MSETTGGARVHEIQIHLPGLIKILGETLYSEPEVAVREMIQNGHDACLRRMAEDEGFRSPRIDIEANSFQRTLTFRDNGSGLTEGEIHEFLSTVGKGYTAELRQALAEKNRDLAARLIGQFGLGLLSAFIIAEHIEIQTRSYKAGVPGFVWQCDGNVTYTLAEADKKDVGSEVIITISPKYVDTMLKEDVLARVIKVYADFLSIPIHLNRSRMPVNVMEAPWHRKATQAEYREYVRKRYEEIPPLEVIPVEHEEEDLSVRGVLYIPRHTMIEIKTYGDVDVYISRMFICSGDRDLLPVWAKFVRGIIDSPSLTPTLSRETVRKDEKYRRVQAVLSRAILDHLERLAVEAPRQLSEVVTSHNTLIKAWALEDDVFFDKICDLVLFDTEYAKMNIPTYLQRFGAKGQPVAAEARHGEKEQAAAAATQTIYYFSEVGSGTQQKILFKEAGLCVIDASYGAEEAFLRKYDERHKDVEIKKLDAGAGYIFEPIKDDKDGRWAKLEDEFRNRKLPARVVRFRPFDIPAVLVRVDEDEEHDHAVRKIAEDQDVNPELRRFFKQLLRERETYQRDSLTHGASLHLNAANAIIQQLATSEEHDMVRDLAMTLLYNNAVLFESHSVTPENAQLMFRANNMAIEQLIEKHEKVQELENDLTRKKLEHADALEEQRQYARVQEEKARSVATQMQEAGKQVTQLRAELSARDDLMRQQSEKHQAGVKSLEARLKRTEEGGMELQASNDRLARDLAQLRERTGSMADGILKSLDTRTSDVFVMRPFTQENRWVYDNCIRPACEIHNLTPIYLEEADYAGRIFDDIIRHIRECGILIADVTDRNPNVMYEVGAAHILGKSGRTILVGKDTMDLPFDVSNFRVFPYGKPAEAAGLRGRLEKALEAIRAALRKGGQA